MDIYIDDQTNDLKFNNGDLIFTSDFDFATTMSQRISCQLKTYLGEYFRDDQTAPEIGVPYYQKLFGIKRPSQALADNIFRNALLNVPGVSSVLALNFLLDNKNRKLDLEFSVRITKGDIESTLVNRVQL